MRARVMVTQYILSSDREGDPEMGPLMLQVLISLYLSSIFVCITGVMA